MKIKLIQQSNLFKSLKVIEDTVRDDLINFNNNNLFELLFSFLQIIWLNGAKIDYSALFNFFY